VSTLTFAALYRSRGAGGFTPGFLRSRATLGGVPSGISTTMARRLLPAMEFLAYEIVFERI
jgi:hypothetical protein